MYSRKKETQIEIITNTIFHLNAGKCLLSRDKLLSSMKDGIWDMLKIMMLSGALLIFCIFTGCTENTNNMNENQNHSIDAQLFVGDWNGTQIKNEIPLNITFNANKTGMFQGIKITWELNGTVLEFGMFEGESPSYYEILFSNNNETLKLTNLYSDEIFELNKN